MRLGRQALALTVLSAMAFLTSPATPQEKPDPAGLEFFEKKIRPLLAERCFECHGPTKQKSGLRLDSMSALLKGGDRGPPIVPGNPEKSLLLKAIGYADQDLRMPPKGKLPEQAIADLTAWVKMGAPAPRDGGATTVAKTFDMAERLKHWAYQPVRAAPPPNVNQNAWPLSPVDNFILAKLEAAGLSPAPPAEKRSLLRRVTFDLIGLPPTPAEIHAFLTDESPDAFPKVVDRLLASPHYGERWGRHWLDLVRYAETLGHEFDFDIHNAWRYRDYVIRAFNDDLPYDRFVIEHLAGDLLPQPRRHATEKTDESIVATGAFWLGEGKQAPVDVRQEQADRIDNQIDVLGKAFLAQTVACARCHDHKFDAIPTKDYYALAGYLKSSRYQQAFLDPPELIAAKAKQLAVLQIEIKRALGLPWREAATEMPRYLLAARPLLIPTPGQAPTVADTARTTGLNAERLQRWVTALKLEELRRPENPLHDWFLAALRNGFSEKDIPAKSMEELKRRAEAPAAFEPFEGSDPRPPGTLRYESFMLTQLDHGWFVTGTAFGDKTCTKGDIAVDTTQAARPIRLAAEEWAHSGSRSPRLEGEMRSKTFTIDKPYLHIRAKGRGGRINVVIAGFNIIRDPIYGGLAIEVNQEAPQWRTIKVDMWLGHRAHIELIDSTTPNPSANPGPDAAAGKPGNSYLAVDEIWFSEHQKPPETKPAVLPASLYRDGKGLTVEVLATRYGEELTRLFEHWAKSPESLLYGGEGLSDLVNWLLDQGLLDVKPAEKLLARYRELESNIPAPARAPALADGTGEDERVFLRGNHKTPGESAPRALLTAVAGPHQPAPKEGSGRLELARRLASADNPLFARVMVNRLWQHHFGEGLVRTPDDFGRMGEHPTHPELLDYLATELVRCGWSIKEMHRLLLLSQTYQMASRIEPKGTAVDPQNRLWHHVPVRRLEAEVIRDALLAVSGRLDVAMSGPGVQPYLTPFMEGRGRPGASGPLDGAGRRSVYLAVRRNFLNPMLLAFDYPIPFNTIGRRTVSNVPAQALALMNDPFVLQQARLWAERALKDTAKSPDERIVELYLTAFARRPSAQELDAASAFLASQSKELGCGTQDVRVWTDLCHVLINVKEFVFVE